MCLLVNVFHVIRVTNDTVEGYEHNDNVKAILVHSYVQHMSDQSPSS